MPTINLQEFYDEDGRGCFLEEAIEALMNLVNRDNSRQTKEQLKRCQDEINMLQKWLKEYRETFPR